MMLEAGKFYLFACPWDWTYVGEWVRWEGITQAVIRNAGYFTRTGLTFDLLTTKGFAGETRFHPTPGGVEQLVSAPFNLVLPWRADKPWMKGGGR